MPWTWTADQDLEDPTDWRVWWEYNKDAYLNQRAQIHRWSVTKGEDFFLGDGGGARAALGGTREAVRRYAVPALFEAIEKGGSNELVTGMMLTLARIGENDGGSLAGRFEPTLRWFLEHGTDQTNRSAAVAMGVLADGASLENLVGLLADDETGRRLVGKREVGSQTRAFAAYGLGLLGYRTQDPELRRSIVVALYEAIDSPLTSMRDVKTAAMIALGMVPIHESTSAPDCDCGGLYHDIETSREAQIAHLLEILEQPKRDHYLLRAHAATALARLCTGAPESLKQRSAEALLRIVSRNSRERDEVAQSAVLALGRLGDADRDPVDAAIRSNLIRVAGHADEQSRRFALIALAQVGSREGSGAEAMAGTSEVRQFLMRQLSRGKNRVRPWAGLALGVMGRGLMDAGHERSSSADRALQNSLRNCRSAEQVGAFAIACGIRHDSRAADLALGQLERINDDRARGYTALALGLMGAREAIEPLEAIVRAEEHRVELHTQAAIALGLLADSQAVSGLIQMLDTAESPEAKASVAAALGFVGDPRSIRSLSELVSDLSAPERSRTLAAIALGVVADSDERSWNSRLSAGINYRAGTVSLTNEEGWGVLDIR